MPRINPVDHATADGEAKRLLDGVKAGLGVVPNIFATLVQSPKALEGFLSLNGALGEGKLPPALREQIAKDSMASRALLERIGDGDLRAPPGPGPQARQDRGLS